ncbi:hypothetical protein TVNIR_2921 [Thioalkalivibrio nitratireducens DSM 14787]|uniref:Uncharacterized protein n=1 Tax=Thioalkalivibrio nitratireducens (strain DSM 14787 / UNIQEM 213 / ALEN2) TaxID=1255043 RepID=L0DZS9_THIND|nr:hypothetical protein TVNIR_2921 [Thioalkalivibrio nitratireducens DSM 14787]
MKAGDTTGDRGFCRGRIGQGLACYRAGNGGRPVALSRRVQVHAAQWR